jgi:predicted anti-sigma-YlaC factor YlaD
MKDEHIYQLLDSDTLGNLSESERIRINEHTSRCSACRRAFEAAQLSAMLLHQRAAVKVEPSPFFKTTVMATIRENRAPSEPFSFLRLWKEASLIIYSMTGLAVLLAVLTFSLPVSETQTESSLNAGTPELPELIVLGTDSPSNDEMSYGQVLTDIYYLDSGEEGPDGNQQK